MFKLAAAKRIGLICGSGVQFVDDNGDPAFPYVYLKHHEIVICLQSDGRFSTIMRADGAIGKIRQYNVKEAFYDK